METIAYRIAMQFGYSGFNRRRVIHPVKSVQFPGCVMTLDQ